jgi:hypothetical protein
MSDAWIVDLTAVTATGNLKQLFPTWCSAGVVPGAVGDLRRTYDGELKAVQVKTDNTNAGYVEIWDLTGADAGADVSSLDVVTNAQLVALQALGKAKLIWNQNFTATSGATTPNSWGKTFMHGLAARFVNAGPTGTCTLNLDVIKGFGKTYSTGS